MAKLIEYDVSGVEESTGGTGVKVKPGVRVAKIEQCEQREKKSNGDPANDIKVALNFGPEYDWGFTYIGLSEAADWKLAEFIRAVQLKDKGKMDPAKQVGKFVRVKVNSGEYEGEYSPNMGRLMPVQPGDEEAWEAGNGSGSELSGQGSEGPDDDETPADEATGEHDGFYREGLPDPDGEIVGSYEDWSDEDLELEVTDRDLTLPGGRGGKKTKMIKALRDNDEEVAEGGGEPEPEEEPTADAEGDDDYDSWDVDQLKTEWAERELGDLPTVRGSNAEGRLMAKLVEGLRADDSTNPFEA